MDLFPPLYNGMILANFQSSGTVPEVKLKLKTATMHVIKEGTLSERDLRVFPVIPSGPADFLASNVCSNF